MNNFSNSKISSNFISAFLQFYKRSKSAEPRNTFAIFLSIFIVSLPQETADPESQVSHLWPEK
jgi:hypothetical protein